MDSMFDYLDEFNSDIDKQTVKLTKQIYDLDQENSRLMIKSEIIAKISITFCTILFISMFVTIFANLLGVIKDQDTLRELGHICAIINIITAITQMLLIFTIQSVFNKSKKSAYRSSSALFYYITTKFATTKYCKILNDDFEELKNDIKKGK